MSKYPSSVPSVVDLKNVNDIAGYGTKAGGNAFCLLQRVAAYSQSEVTVKNPMTTSSALRLILEPALLPLAVLEKGWH